MSISGDELWIDDRLDLIRMESGSVDGLMDENNFEISFINMKK